MYNKNIVKKRVLVWIKKLFQMQRKSHIRIYFFTKNKEWYSKSSEYLSCRIIQEGLSIKSTLWGRNMGILKVR